VGVELIEAALARQDTLIQPGHAVFIRTGSLARWGEAGHDHDALRGGDASGLTLAGARFLVEQLGAVLVGSDTSMVEVFPAVDGQSWHPVHQYLLIEQGVHMGELHNFEELAQAGVTTFCYIALLPKLRGITGGFAMRPIAVV
jgi:kynurenine formamidase